MGVIAKHQNAATLLRRNYMTQALMADTVRGDDSTGVFYSPFTKVGEAGWVKDAVDGYRFVQDKDYQNVELRMGSLWFCIGHNRAATVGAVSQHTAHPFQEGPITMVHNGTLRSTHALDKSMTELDGVTVDSHALCHNLALSPPDKVGENVISKIDGAFALVWHDARDDSLNIVRNSERPLHLALNKAGDALYMASEAAMLSWLGTRLSLSLDTIVYPEPGVHLKYSRGDMVPKVAKYELAVRSTYANNAHGYYRRGVFIPYNGAWWEDDETGTAATTVIGTGKPPDIKPTRRRADPPKYLPRAERQVLLGGRRREIPTLAQKILWARGLSIMDDLVFTPVLKHQKPPRQGNRREYCYVVGTVLNRRGEQDTAVIYNMDLTHAEDSWNRRWLVRPVAMNCDLVVVKLQHTVADSGNDCSTGSSAHPKMERPQSTNYSAMDSETTVVMGPGEQMMNILDWLTITEGGCTACKADLLPDEADTVYWTTDLRPMCIDCFAYMGDKSE